jgi:hypothetical protein
VISHLLHRAGVAVLFARSDSCYIELVDDIYDIERDARNYSGTLPVVCHPPCRGWGRLSHLAKPRDGEKDLGFFAVDTVRRCGGVLEHPHASKLWAAALLPRPGSLDAWGGYTILVDQGWWGHAAPKPTWLYICGVPKAELPTIPIQLHRAAGRTLDLSPADRERTPLEFAKWLVLVASMAVTPSQACTVTPTGCPVRRSSYIDLDGVLIG